MMRVKASDTPGMILIRAEIAMIMAELGTLALDN